MLPPLEPSALTLTSLLQKFGLLELLAKMPIEEKNRAHVD
jgi:hypothetical protein